MEVQYCPTCQEANSRKMTHCTNCGERLEPTITQGKELRQRLSEHLNSASAQESNISPDKTDKEEAIADVANQLKEFHLSQQDTPNTDKKTYLVDVPQEVVEQTFGQVLNYENVKLTVVDSGFEFSLSFIEQNEVMLGRAEHGFMTMVDLNRVNGREQGVSRHHATIVRQDRLLLLIDHNSSNGTYLNGLRIMPEQPRILRNGDILQLGLLKLRINYDVGD